ncbi:MAG: T9SS type A sorting domain-containing protein, partial [Candidatus Cloacimonetes bacterium]|nr:T9SS type A sorting domain-containing protein [Candidatus Cloacimonadota bacterium]
IGNYPNPFNPAGAGRSPETTISFSLTAEDAENAEIEIYNIKGQKVKTLSTSSSSGLETRSVVWDGTDENNQPVSSGIYFYRLVTDRYSETKKMLLLR